jgi:cell division protein FtsW
MNAKGLFEMVLASCLSAVLAAQVVVNLGVVAGLVPPKGLVLPFMSYGASALISHMVMIAILLRVGLETRRSEIAAEQAVQRAPARAGA